MAAKAGHEADSRVLYLSRPIHLAAQLSHRLNDMKNAGGQPGVTMSMTASMRNYGYLSPYLDPLSTFDESAAVAFFAEAEIFEEKYRRD